MWLTDFLNRLVDQWISGLTTKGFYLNNDIISTITILTPLSSTKPSTETKPMSSPSTTHHANPFCLTPALPPTLPPRLPKPYSLPQRLPRAACRGRSVWYTCRRLLHLHAHLALMGHDSRLCACHTLRCFLTADNFPALVVGAAAVKKGGGDAHVCENLLFRLVWGAGDENL